MILIVIFICILFFIIKLNKNYFYINNFSNIKKNILIIGNAPIKYKNLGEKINKFEIVVRFNDFNINDYKKDIGTKIDYWIVSESFILFDYERFIKKYNIYNNKKIFVIIPYVFKNNIKKLKNKLPKNIYNNLNILIEHIDIKHNYNFNNKWPSSGLLVILYILQKYKYNIFIFGFNNFSHKEKKIHYFEDKGKLNVSKQIGHIPHLEKKIINNLKNNKKLFNLHIE